MNLLTFHELFNFNEVCKNNDRKHKLSKSIDRSILSPPMEHWAGKNAQSISQSISIPKSWEANLIFISISKKYCRKSSLGKIYREKKISVSLPKAHFPTLNTFVWNMKANPILLIFFEGFTIFGKNIAPSKHI